MKLYIIALFALYYTGLKAQSVEPMLTTKWGQDTLYENAYPNNSVAGCGPVALAQILNYYKQPAHGYGHVKYSMVDIDLENTIFDWQNMLNVYKNGNYTDAQAQAVTELVYACGAAVHAKYNGDSTSTSYYPRILYGMQHHLHISPESRYYHREYYSTAEWIEMLNEQLRNGHPVFYCGNWTYMSKPYSHMFVIDGLNDEGKYHVNFGIYGHEYFVDLNVLNQLNYTKYPGGQPVCYNADQEMVINCYPTPDCEEYVKQACIMDGSILINNDKSIETISVNKGESFNLTYKIRNFSDDNTYVDSRWTLEDNGNIVKEYFNDRGKVYYTVGSKINSCISIPNDIENGSYTLKLYTKSEEEPEWQEVWTNAPTNVSVMVNDKSVTITPPNNHMGNPLLYLGKEAKDTIAETKEYAKVSGRYICLHLINNTTNNFFDNIKLEFVADGETYTYEKKLPMYSQSKTEYHVFIPNTAIDLEGKTIQPSSIKASYYYDGKYIEMGLTEPSGIKTIEHADNNSVVIYNLQGVMVRKIKAEEVSTSYGDVLNGLQNGIYIVKEGKNTRKIAIY